MKKTAMNSEQQASAQAEVQEFLNFIGLSYGSTVRATCERLLKDRLAALPPDALTDITVRQSLFEQAIADLFRKEHKLTMAVAEMPFTSD